MEGAGRILNAASWMVAAGAALSGPVAMGVVLWAAPQPAWSGVVPFVEHYHPIQGLPYLLGFLLLGGFILFVSACHAGAAERHRARTTAALLFTSTYAALVFLNYALQVGLVPRLVPAAPRSSASSPWRIPTPWPGSWRCSGTQRWGSASGCWLPSSRTPAEAGPYAGC